jgi:ribosomal protein S18 acetylase RimI-like enzyme
MVRPITTGDTLALRHLVLRPDKPAEALVYPGDDAPGTLHVAARDDAGAIVGIATVSEEPHPRDPRPGDWRIRGMATAPEIRGRGIGAELLRACVDHARERGGTRVWCNARTPAIGLYERAGFVVESEEFEIAGIGPHVVMSLPLRPAAGGAA